MKPTIETVREFLAAVGAELVSHVEDHDGHVVEVRYLGITSRGHARDSVAHAVLDAARNHPRAHEVAS